MAKLEITTLKNQETVLDETALVELKSRLRGPLILRAKRATTRLAQFSTA